MELVLADGYDDHEKQEKYQKLSTKYSEISSNLKRTNFKKNVMTEAAEIFYEADPNFNSKLDVNKDLLCFNNGILDFSEKIFRCGKPEDYVSLCTNIDYIGIDYHIQEHNEIISEINDFMNKLFPNDDLKRYMWEHLASSLIGHNKNQTFNIYNNVKNIR
jgi:phage/plasmid-associated DNA primase